MKRIIICLTLALLYANTHISANACNQHNQSTHELSEEDKAVINQVEENAIYTKTATRQAAINAASEAKAAQEAMDAVSKSTKTKPTREWCKQHGTTSTELGAVRVAACDYLDSPKKQ